jgi:hypothetical protein
MELEWKIDLQDVRKVKAFFRDQKDAAFVRHRIQKNVKDKKPRITKAGFWQSLVSCLLTTQQRSGPDTAVSRFIRTKPFPLNYRRCCTQQNLRKWAEENLGSFGGLRRWRVIADEVTANFSALEGGLWKETLSVLDRLRRSRGAKAERNAAEFIEENFRGFGPKQSRNLLQLLRLTKYETPIDSRITKWLNEFGFPVKLSAQSLGNRDYYCFVSDGFQALCKQSGIYPCELDAAIFSSFDRERWTEDELVW